MKHPYVTSYKTHAGGSPVIAGTKFPVKSVVFYILRQGMAPEEFVKEFSHLTLPEVYDALSYYYEHKTEIDIELSQNEDDNERTRFKRDNVNAMKNLQEI